MQATQHNGLFSPISAAQFLREEFPEVPVWTALRFRSGPEGVAMSRIASGRYEASGRIGSWTWTRIPCNLPPIGLFNGELDNQSQYGGWLGMIRVTHADGRSFMLFSYYNNEGKVCHHYLASTDDWRLLRTFLKAVVAKFDRRSPNVASIYMMNAQDIDIDCRKEETIFLQDNMADDILGQVDAFFAGRKMFERLGAPYRRGFLFAGDPGNGKSMMIRKIVRRAHQKYKAYAISLSITNDLTHQMLQTMFDMAQAKAPSVLLIEDLESIMVETQVTRSAFLGMLDGMSSSDGILVVCTTNNPEKIDPALAHRPSRFDRVWTFPVPDAALRFAYLKHYYPQMPESLLERVSRKTANWSFAYLNELRTTTAILAIRDGSDTVTEPHLQKGQALLGEQFDAGIKNHAVPASPSNVGFNASCG